MKLQIQGLSIKHQIGSIQSEYDHKYLKFQEKLPYQNLLGKLTSQKYKFKTNVQIGRVGLMLVGMGGNNGTTLIGGIIANKKNISWNTKKGLKTSNTYGSMTQNSTMKVGQTQTEQVFMRIKDVMQLLNPTDLVFGGWDINSDNLAVAMRKAQVFDYQLQKQLEQHMETYRPMKSIYYPDFIASNQNERANNVLEGEDKLSHLSKIRSDIKNFRQQNQLEKVIVLWTANTERFTQVAQELHGTYDAIRQSIKRGQKQISPSTIFAIAALEQDCVFINGSPQNTFLPGMTEIKTGIFIGNDFKTGQTKFKTAFMDFLTGAGIKPKSIVSYNHLGNNDGKNLSSERQFKSKETSKSECISDILKNSLLFQDARKNPEQKQCQGPDHTVVIKYVPNAGDSKKAIDQYVSQIFMGGQHTFVSYNVCEDSLLAAGIIMDLIVMSELMTRISYKKNEDQEWRQIKGVVSFLGYLMKAPQSQGPTINCLTRQRTCIQNLIRILRGLPLEDNLLLNYRL